MSEEPRKAVEAKILQCLQEGWEDPLRPGLASDEDFLDSLLKGREELGCWRFASYLELEGTAEEIVQPSFDADIVLNLYEQLLDTARSIGRARKLLAEREVAVESKG